MGMRVCCTSGVPYERPPADEIEFIGEGHTVCGPWVLESWRDSERRWVALRHPDWPPGYGGGRGVGTSSAAVQGGWVTFYGPTSDTRRTLIVGVIQPPASRMRFEGEDGACTDAVVFPISGDPHYRAFVVPLDDPPTGRIVALDAGGDEVDRQHSTGVEEFRAQMRPLNEAKRRELAERRGDEPH